MLALTSISLKCGARVSRGAALTVHHNIKTLVRENPYAVYDLYQRCIDPKFKFVKNPLGDSQQILKERRLLQENGSVHQEVQKMIKGFVEINSNGEVNIAPLSFRQITAEVPIHKDTFQ
jgi:hypothetical protein